MTLPKDDTTPPRRVERAISLFLLRARWLLVVFYGGLAVALVAYAGHFLVKLAKTVAVAATASANEMLLAMLALVDATLVGSLIVMVMLSGYENFVAPLRHHLMHENLDWLGKLDTGTIKIKMATAIVAISSIHLLQVFLNIESYDSGRVWQMVGIHTTFVVSAILLAGLDRIVTAGKDKK
ncbi:MAG: hypothetical protein EAZ99_09350 [Alphaproteobacteria bacterium]|nr:YqhA family protein [Alphaproteobacteria bacterium]TAD89585.1 MAG: hypothetical protein EAZ99_09350 [Alphaproteobacteria bacterium]